MKLTHICFLLCLAVPVFSSTFSFDTDPQITITSPIEGKEFASGTTINLNLSVTCNCEMDQVMLTMMNNETDKETLLSALTPSLVSNLSGYTQTVTLPIVTEETDITFEIAVMDKDGEDMESEAITITVMP